MSFGVNEVTFGKHLRGGGARRSNHAVTGLELSVLPLDFQGGESDLRVSHPPMASDLASHD